MADAAAPFRSGSPDFQNSVQALIQRTLIETLRQGTPYLIPGACVAAPYVQGGGTPESEATFRYFNVADLDVGTPTPITEGTPPAAVGLALSHMDFIAAQYAKIVHSTDIAVLQSTFNIPGKMVEVIAEWGKQTMDALAKAAWSAKPAGEKVILATGGPSGSTTAAKTNPPALYDFKHAAAVLSARGVPKIGGDYIALVDAATGLVLRSETGENSLQQVKEYAAAGDLLSGEIGRVAGLRFVETGGKAIADGTVQRSIVTGANALAYSELSQIASAYIAPVPSAADPLGLSAYASTKFFFGAKTINIGGATAADSLRYVVVEATAPAL